MKPISNATSRRTVRATIVPRRPPILLPMPEPMIEPSGQPKTNPSTMPKIKLNCQTHFGALLRPSFISKPRSKWTLRSRMAINSSSRPRSIGGGMLLSGDANAASMLIRNFNLLTHFERLRTQLSADRARFDLHANVRKPLRRNGRAKSARLSVERTGETLVYKSLRRDSNAARRGSPAQDAQRPAANRGLDKALFPLHAQGLARSAATP